MARGALPKMETWRKVSGKHHVRDGKGGRKVYGPGQKDGDTVRFPIGAGPNRKDTSWQPVDVPTEGEAYGVEAEITELEIVARGGGWFDVVNPVTGKPVNPKSLRQEEAEELAGKLYTSGEEKTQSEDDDGDDEE